MTTKRRKRDIEINEDAEKGMCYLVDEGFACDRKIHCQNVCGPHYIYLLRHRLVSKYGKPKYTYCEDEKYDIKMKINPKVCRLTVNGKGCFNPIHGRGLCANHWLKLERHGLLDKYGAISRKRERKFKIKPGKFDGLCRMVEDFEPCNNEARCRGLCHTHYLRFLRSDEIKKYGYKIGGMVLARRRNEKANNS